VKLDDKVKFGRLSEMEPENLGGSEIKVEQSEIEKIKKNYRSEISAENSLEEVKLKTQSESKTK
jgi:hypothetical protein